MEEIFFENLQTFVLVLLYGGLVLQSFIVLVNPMNVNKRANFFFGLFLFFWSSFWLLNVLKFCGLPPNELFTFLIQSLQIFTPVSLFFSVVFFINPDYGFKKNDLVCLIIPVIYWILLFNGQHNPASYSAAMLIDVSHNLPYIVIIYFKIRHYQKRIKSISSSTENINLQWLIKLTVLLFVTIVITVWYEFYNAFVYKRHQHLLMDILYLLIVYISAYYSLRQKEIYPADKKQRAELLSVETENEAQADKKKLIADDDFENLKQHLKNLMETQKPFLDGELNLLKLADLMQLNVHQLSYLLNNGFGENFFQFVNKYRVAQAKKLLQDDSKTNLSMLGIAFESGFNSKTTFNTIFKKMTNLTPSEFKKKHSTL